MVPLFSKICMYRYWALGFARSPWENGGIDRVAAALVSGDLGSRCAVYRFVQVSMMGTIWAGVMSARVRWWEGVKHMT